MISIPKCDYPLRTAPDVITKQTFNLYFVEENPISISILEKTNLNFYIVRETLRRDSPKFCPSTGPVKTYAGQPPSFLNGRVFKFEKALRYTALRFRRLVSP